MNDKVASIYIAMLLGRGRFIVDEADRLLYSKRELKLYVQRKLRDLMEKENE